jgi:hypothetical protein
MNRNSPAFLHQDATASSLGLTRALVFGIWLYQLATDPLQRLAELPHAAFDPPGVLRVLPGAVWDHLLEAPVLLAFKAGLLLALTAVILGLARSKVLLALTVGGLIGYQGIVRGFSGHINHAELALLYISLLLVFFPVFDGLTVWTLRGRPGPSEAGQQPNDRAPYVTAMLAACLILSLTYFFVGAVRLWKGIDLFGSPALRGYIAEHALQGGRFDRTTTTPLSVPAAALGLPLWFLQVAFALSTVLELAVPLALFSRRLRPVIVLGLLVFHTTIWAFMDVPFPENMCLLALFSGVGLHRIAARLDQRADLRHMLVARGADTPLR